MADVFEQLRAMRTVPENWDGYGAAAPEAEVVALAEEFVRLLQMIRPTYESGFGVQASPTRTGGVGLDWETPGFEHEVEFEPDGTVSFLHTNVVTGEMQNRRFAPDGHAIRAEILRELRSLAA